MIVREYKESDIPQISSLYYHTVHHINSRDYSPEQIQVWAPEIYPDANWLRRFDNYTVFIAQEDDQITGFVEFQYPGHIDCFYVHHEWQRQGTGRLLLDAVEKEAATLEVTRLFVDASITAQPFFTHMGFRTVREQRKTFRDLTFVQYFMEKMLRG